MENHDPSRWNDIFKDSWKSGIAGVFKRYADNEPMFEYMSDILNSGTLLEVGSGRGVNSIILRFLNPQAKCIVTDYLSENISLMQESLSLQGINLKETSFSTLDILNQRIPENVDLAFSDGVLEHFSQQEIKTALVNQSSAKNVFVIVPCNNADIDYGDEWIASYGAWMGLITSTLPNAKVSGLPIGHKGVVFRLLRKFIPYYKSTGRTKVIVSSINKLLLPIELRCAATVGFTIQR